jgi:hypothetical protein
MNKHEYAFDIKMFAVVRVQADNEEKARSALERALDCADLMVRLSDVDGDMLLTEASMHLDDELGPSLFEIDGQMAE